MCPDTDPVVGELVVELDGQAERAEDDIRDDETHDERVGRSVEATMTHEHADDDAVAAHADHDDHHVDEHDRHLCSIRHNTARQR